MTEERNVAVLSRAEEFATKIFECDIRDDTAERARTREAWQEFLDTDALSIREEAVRAYYEQYDKLLGLS